MKRNWQKLREDDVFRKRFEQRSEIVFGIRKHFRERGFFEAETPAIVESPDMEPHLSPVSTGIMRHDGKVYPASLITSPEYSLKKLLAVGYERIFEIARCFRDGEPWNGMHNPEFAMLEWYRLNADYTEIMSDTEEMVNRLCKLVNGSCFTPDSSVRGSVDLSLPWERVSVSDAFSRYAGLDLGAGIENPTGFVEQCRKAGHDVSVNSSFDDAFFKVFLDNIEPKLGKDKPVILYDYPSSMAALAKLKDSDSRFAERFEVYISGIELCNAFSELTDPVEQRARFEIEHESRKLSNLPTFRMDEQLLLALESIDSAAGIALGVDRLVMLLTGAASIDEVLFFPAQDIFQ